MAKALSENFDLDEFLRSEFASRNDIDMTPPATVVTELGRLVETVLQPLRDSLEAPIWITSGYRPAELNLVIGGSRTSAHMFGRAADLRAVGYTPLEVCERIVELELPFDQVIYEFGPDGWTHVGIAPADDEPRLEQLTAYRRNRLTRYVFGLIEPEDLDVVPA